MASRARYLPLGIAVLLGAAWFAVRGTWPWKRLADIPTAQAIVVRDPFRVVHDTLQPGETVSGLLAREGVGRIDLGALTSGLGIDLSRIRAGLEVLIRHNIGTDSATNVEFRPSPEQRLQFTRTADGNWTAALVPVRWTTDTIRCSVEIRTTLYDALDDGACDATFGHDQRLQLAWQLADINGYNVDFSRDPQPGDRLVTVLQRQVSEDGEIRMGRVLASRLWINHRTYEAYDYPAAGGDAYYDADGGALRRAFLLSPVDYRYISSGFSSLRYHPILKLWRKHEGIDFAAASGSPVMASGDGVVAVAGWSGGYGKMVEIHHPNGIVTRYGHLSAIGIGIRPGVRVTQGEQIGRVGMTGLATGPHLHYEFRVDGVARDPRTVRNDAAPPLASSQLADFERQRALLAQLLGDAPQSLLLGE